MTLILEAGAWSAIAAFIATPLEALKDAPGGHIVTTRATTDVIEVARSRAARLVESAYQSHAAVAVRVKVRAA